MQCRGQLRHEVTKKAIKAALKLCMHVICYIWVTLRTCLWNGFQNRPGAAQDSLPHLTHPIQLISSLEETEMGQKRWWELRENTMSVRSTCSAATCLKEIAAKNNLITSCCDVCSSRIKEKKRKSITFIYSSCKYSSVFSLEFSVW